MTLLKVGPLPKVNSGGHNRPGGVFAGHADDAAELKRLAKRSAPQQWGCVRAGVKSPTASRTAMVIRKGIAVDFQPDEDGYFIAKSRQGEDYVKKVNEVFEVWVKFKLWESEEEKRKVLASVERARARGAKQPEPPAKPARSRRLRSVKEKVGV